MIALRLPVHLNAQSILRKKVKPSVIITWYCLYFIVFFLVYLGAIAWLLIVLYKNEAQPREIIIPGAIVLRMNGTVARKVKRFFTTKVFVRR